MVASVIDLLTRDEGEVLHVYLDSRGIQTLGIGRRVDEKGGISRVEARFLLVNDIQLCTDDLTINYGWFKKLTPVRQAVLLSMRFVFGHGGLNGWPTFLSQMESGAYNEAAANLRTSQWHGQAPQRVEQLAEMLETNAWV